MKVPTIQLGYERWWPARRDHRLGNGYSEVARDQSGSGVSLPKTVLDRGARGVDASTPVLGQNHRFVPRSGVRQRLFGHDMLSPIPDVPLPPTPGSQLIPDFISQQQADLKADLLVTVARLQSKVRALKLASPIQPNLATRTQLARRRSATFTCWDQYRQVLDAIVRSNGWDDDTVAL